MNNNEVPRRTRICTHSRTRAAATLLLSVLAVVNLSGCTGAIHEIGEAAKAIEIEQTRRDALARVKPPTSLASVDTCYTTSWATEINYNNVVTCSGSYELRLFAIVTLEGTSYPGDSRIVDIAIDACRAADDQQQYVQSLTPGCDEWTIAGDREVLCFSADGSGHTESLQP